MVTNTRSIIRRQQYTFFVFLQIGFLAPTIEARERDQFWIMRGLNFWWNAKKKRIFTGFACVKFTTVATSDEVDILRTLEVVLPEIVAHWVRVARLDLDLFRGSTIATIRIRFWIGCRDDRFGGRVLIVRSTVCSRARSGVDLCRIQRDDLWKRLEIKFWIKLVCYEWSGAIRADAVSNGCCFDNRHEKHNSEDKKRTHNEWMQSLDWINANTQYLGSTDGLLNRAFLKSESRRMLFIFFPSDLDGGWLLWIQKEREREKLTVNSIAFATALWAPRWGEKSSNQLHADGNNQKASASGQVAVPGPQNLQGLRVEVPSDDQLVRWAHIGVGNISAIESSKAGTKATCPGVWTKWRKL